MADFSTALENPSAKGVLIDIEDNAQDNSKADTTTNFESMDRLVHRMNFRPVKCSPPERYYESGKI